jgi:hypothetical protein
MGLRVASHSCPWDGARGRIDSRRGLQSFETSLRAAKEGGIVNLSISHEGGEQRGHRQKDRVLR